MSSGWSPKSATQPIGRALDREVAVLVVARLSRTSGGTSSSVSNSASSG